MDTNGCVCMNRRSLFKMVISVAAVEVFKKKPLQYPPPLHKQPADGRVTDHRADRGEWVSITPPPPPSPLFPLRLFVLLPQTALWRLTGGARRGAGLSIFISDLNKIMILSGLKAFPYRAAFYRFFLGG